MRSFVLAVLIVAMSAAAFAQLDSYTVTVTESRSQQLPVDQLSIVVYVNAGLDKTLADVLAIVKPKGLTQANFTTLQTYTLTGQASYLRWSFQQTIPAADLSAYATDFLIFRNGVVAQNPSVTVDFYTGALTPGPAPDCPTTAMVSDARVQAQALAQAGGFGVGEISTISDGGSGPVAAYAATSFNLITGVVGILTQPALFSPQGPTCALTVKFKLTLN